MLRTNYSDEKQLFHRLRYSWPDARHAAAFFPCPAPALTEIVFSMIL
jgi:hypothetical protein